MPVGREHRPEQGGTRRGFPESLHTAADDGGRYRHNDCCGAARRRPTAFERADIDEAPAPDFSIVLCAWRSRPLVWPVDVLCGSDDSFGISLDWHPGVVGRAAGVGAGLSRPDNQAGQTLMRPYWNRRNSRMDWWRPSYGNAGGALRRFSASARLRSVDRALSRRRFVDLARPR